MIQVGKDGVLKRGEVKVGWLRDNHIFDHTDTKVGYFEGQNIFNIQGKRIAYIEGDFMVLIPADSRVHLEDNAKAVMGAVSDVARAAICLLIG